ncbi:MAG TPA: YtxH domain-containing protein [Anaerolineales bacterium]|jgi:gas vesicle protein
MSKDHQEHENSNKNILGVLVGTLIGGLLGAVTMLLMAPQSGKRTRKLIQQKGFELRDQTTGMVEDTMAQVRKDGKKIAKTGRQKAKELMKQGQDLVDTQFGIVSDVFETGKKALMRS